MKHKNTQPLYIFNRENTQNSEPQNGPRSGLDYIALPPIDIGEGIPLLLENLHIIDISSTTYLPYFVNVVKERPLNALLGPFAPLKLRLNCCSKSSKCVRAA